MQLLIFEAEKILFRKLSLILLLVTVILLPTIIKVLSHMTAMEKEIAEGLFVEATAYGVVSIAEGYTFLPLWIIVFVGSELTNGHVDRVVFLASRKDYFISKLIFGALVAVLFTVIGIAAFIFSVNTAPYSSLSVTHNQVFFFAAQLLLLTLSFAGFILSITFIFRKPIVTFIVYLVWSSFEGVVYIMLDKVYSMKASWLPLHLINTLYCRYGENSKSDNYYNPIVENPLQILPPIIFVSLLLWVTYRVFLKRDLKPLSD